MQLCTILIYEYGRTFMGVNKININNNDSNYAHSIFDISEYTGKTYDTLSDALADIPDGKQKGGMTVSFVSTSDNKYVQYRLMAQNFTTDVTQWQGVDDEPTAGSDNLVKSRGVDLKLNNLAQELPHTIISYADLDVSDENNNIIARFNDGHIKTKKFDSSDIHTTKDKVGLGNVDNTSDLNKPISIPVQEALNSKVSKEDAPGLDKGNGDLDIVDERGNILARYSNGVHKTKYPAPHTKNSNSISDLSFEDENGNIILQVFEGHLKTKNFDSSDPFLSLIPTIVFPSKTYILKGHENNIYHKNYLNFTFPYLYNVSTNANENRIKNLARRFRFEDGIPTGNSSLTVNIVNNFDTIVSSKVASLSVAEVGSGTYQNKNVICIGDSFTYNGTWFDYVNTLLPQLSFVGMRKSYNTDNSLRAEGRGGWTLKEYFNAHDDVTPNHMQPFSPFMHVNGYNYYGVKEFWAAIVNGTSQYTYGTNGFDDYISWFGTDGYKLNPSTNDLMYDGTNERYMYYNGSTWEVATSITDDSFVFDFSKYISLWNISSPDFVIVMLGTNDFYLGADQTSEYWNTWVSRMETMISSIQAYATTSGKTIKVGICTPAQAASSGNNSTINIAPQQHHIRYWEARKRIIEHFDTTAYMNNNVYVIDSGVRLDPDYGFSDSNILPFEEYTGSVREIYNNNGIHPGSDGYKQIGVGVAAFIQNYR